MNRLVWVDYLKTIGIIAVVFGHTRMPLSLVEWIYSFHMPLFFILSGVLLANVQFNVGLAEFYQKRISKLLYAYCIFSAIGAFHYLLTSQLGNVQEDILNVLYMRMLSICYGSATVRDPFTLYPEVLWFFPALILGLFLFYLIKRFFVRFEWPLCFLCLLLGFVLRNTILPWEFETALCAVFFIFLGSEFCAIRKSIYLNPKNPYWIGMVLLISGWVLSHWNGRIDFRNSQFGNILISFPSAVLTILGLYFIFHKASALMFITRISNATLLIFPIHILAFWGIDMILIKMYGTCNLGCFYESVKSILVIGIIVSFSPYLIQILRLNSNKQ